MIILKQFVLLISVLYITGCTTAGPKIVIETNEPAEDFVVLCYKTKDYLIGHNASGYAVIDSIFVAESGKEVDCGVMLGGSGSSVSVLHPVLSSDGKSNYTKNGVKHLIYNKTQLDLLDEQKAKFEAGYWDKYKNPGFEYANSVSGCGISFSYLDKYSKAKKVDKAHFKSLYDKPMSKCLTRLVNVYKKYRPNSSKQYTTGNEWAEKIWNSEKWSKYK